MIDVTAEACVMNKKAVAIAADSAVTKQRKTFTSARKIYELSEEHPVGLMVFGKSEFMGIPWVTIFNIFRERIGDNKPENLEEYGDNLIDLLENEDFANDIEERRYYLSYVVRYFQDIKNDIQDTVQNMITERGKVTESKVEEITNRTIEKYYKKWCEEKEILENFSENDIEKILDRFEEFVTLENEELFEGLPITEGLLGKIRKIAAHIIAKKEVEIEDKHINRSGVVFAGFGRKDRFPAVYPIAVEGKIEGNLKFAINEKKRSKISYENTASVAALAQGDVMATFMEGVNPSYRIAVNQMLFDFIEDYPSIILKEIEEFDQSTKKEYKKELVEKSREILSDRLQELEEYRQNTFVGPIVNVVSMLPKSELAEMAESLVNLTSLKRKLSMEQETVAGPTDVAVISKDDGVSWAKRKDYHNLS